MMWQIRYIRDQSLLASWVTSTVHCLVAMAANAAHTTAKKAKERRAMSHYGKGLILVTALVVGVAAAQSGVGGNVTFDSTKGAVPEFSDEERGRIFDEVMRISEAPVSDMTAPEVADSLPEEVPMQELPTDIIQEIPLVRGHRFVKFDDRILVVSSASRLVVAMIPRYKPLP